MSIFSQLDSWEYKMYHMGVDCLERMTGKVEMEAWQKQANKNWGKEINTFYKSAIYLAVWKVFINISSFILHMNTVQMAILTSFFIEESEHE